MNLKFIKNLNNKYLISDSGEVFSIASGSIYKRKDKNQNGYRSITLGSRKKAKSFLIHRLVAFAFLGDPKPNQEVNHKNGIKHDNRVENLEWVTKSEQQFHVSRVLGKRFKKIFCSNGKEYRSIIEAAEELGLNRSGISQVLSGKYKQTGGYTFVYRK